MTRTMLLVSCLAAVASVGWAQHGRGGGAAGVPGAPPQISKPSTLPAKTTAPGARTGTMDVGARVASNPALSTRLEPLLPAGMSFATAAQGFKNQGQFIAALHVSKNLNIPFADLQKAMTGSSAVSLGNAIQQLRPELDKRTVDAGVKVAESEAKKDVNSK